jgi:hypothetical protein
MAADALLVWELAILEHSFGMLLLIILLTAVTLLGGSIAILGLRWRLRSDDRGLSRRRLIHWDLWKWDEFASGQIQKRGERLVAPSHSWWCREILLEIMASNDVLRVLEIVNTHYRLPDLGDMPESITIRLGFRRRAILGPDSIRIQSRGKVTVYSWTDVQRVYVERRDPARRDFKFLKIVLPRDVVCIANLATALSRKPASEIVNEFVQVRVSPQRVFVGLPGNPIMDGPYLESQLRSLKKRQRRMSLANKTMPPLMLVLCMGLAFTMRFSVLTNSIIALGIFLSFCTMMLLGDRYGNPRINRQRIRKLTELLNPTSAAQSSDSTDPNQTSNGVN